MKYKPPRVSYRMMSCQAQEGNGWRRWKERARVVYHGNNRVAYGNWFPKSVHPVRAGVYRVVDGEGNQSNMYFDPQRCTWKAFTGDNPLPRFTLWCGLTKEEHEREAARLNDRRVREQMTTFGRTV